MLLRLQRTHIFFYTVNSMYEITSNHVHMQEVPVHVLALKVISYISLETEPP